MRRPRRAEFRPRRPGRSHRSGMPAPAARSLRTGCPTSSQDVGPLEFPASRRRPGRLHGVLALPVSGQHQARPKMRMRNRRARLHLPACDPLPPDAVLGPTLVRAGDHNKRTFDLSGSKAERIGTKFPLRLHRPRRYGPGTARPVGCGRRGSAGVGVRPLPEALPSLASPPPSGDGQTCPNCPHDRSRAVGRAKLAEHMAEVIANRLLTDPEPPGDLLVGKTGCNLFQNVQLAKGQLSTTMPGAATAGRQNGEDPIHDVLDGDVLVDVTLGAAGQGLTDHRFVGICAEDQGMDPWGLGHQSPGGFDARDLWHLEIHEDDIRPPLQCLRDRLFAVPSLADHLDAGVSGEHSGKAGSEERLIVRDQDPNGVSRRHARCATGIRTSTRVPPLPLVCAVNVPPRITARSSIPIMPNPRVESWSPIPSSSTMTIASSARPRSSMTSMALAWPCRQAFITACWTMRSRLKAAHPLISAGHLEDAWTLRFRPAGVGSSRTNASAKRSLMSARPRRSTIMPRVRRSTWRTESSTTASSPPKRSSPWCAVLRARICRIRLIRGWATSSWTSRAKWSCSSLVEEGGPNATMPFGRSSTSSEIPSATSCPPTGLPQKAVSGRLFRAGDSKSSAKQAIALNGVGPEKVKFCDVWGRARRSAHKALLERRAARERPGRGSPRTVRFRFEPRRKASSAHG